MAICTARQISGFVFAISMLGACLFSFRANGQIENNVPDIVEQSIQLQGHWRPSRGSMIRPRELGTIVQFVSEAAGMVKFVSCSGESHEVSIGALDRVDGATCGENTVPPGTFSPTIGELGLLASIESSSGVWMVSAEGVYARAGRFSFEQGQALEYSSEGTLTFQIQPSDAFLSQFARIDLVPMELQSARVTIPIEALDFLPNDSGSLTAILTDSNFEHAITNAIISANTR